MANVGDRLVHGFIPAASDLSSYQYRFVKVTASGIALCGAGEKGCGVLLNKPLAGQPCEIGDHGTCKVEMGEACAENDAIMSGASGIGMVATAPYIDSTDPSPSMLLVHGPFVFGFALAAATVSGEVVEILMTLSGLVA